MKKLLLTGYTGFLGKALLASLRKTQFHICLLGRNSIDNLEHYYADFSSNFQCQQALKHTDTVIHCAARAHIMQDPSKDPLTTYRKINVDSTLELARQALAAGVKRFVFLSSIKVNGELTENIAFSESNTTTALDDPYSLSKSEAEKGLLQLSHNSSMEVVIIRPPLVYGPEVKGNFLSLINLVKKRIPLPFACITNNKRSMIALDNLVDFILLCSDRERSPLATNEIFIVSDGEDISTAALFRRVAKAYGYQLILLPVPIFIMVFLAAFLGKRELFQRLTGSLQVDSSKAERLLGWKPIISMEQQLIKMAQQEGQ